MEGGASSPSQAVQLLWQVAEELSRVAPIYLLRPSCAPWTGGVISLTAVVDRLKDLLPPTFEDLNTVRSAAHASLPGYALCTTLRNVGSALASPVCVTMLLNVQLHLMILEGVERHTRLHIRCRNLRSAWCPRMGSTD
jgi:hypothetical protein